MSEGTRTKEGYLLLADISGYTAFLTGTELEHSSEIVRELKTLIRERLPAATAHELYSSGAQRNL